MEILIAGCIAFFITHVGISSTPVRGALRNTLGERPYLGVYTLVSFATLGAAVYGYIQVPHVDFVWPPSTAAYWVTKVLLVLSLVLLVMGYMTKNPTAAMMGEAVKSELPGLLKITRHPIQWAITLFAVGHIIANGDVASIWFFGTLAAVSLIGMWGMDARCRKQEGEHWQQFMGATSTIPFVALLQGRTSLSLSELSWVGLLIGIALYVVVYWLHDLVSGGASLF